MPCHQHYPSADFVVHSLLCLQTYASLFVETTLVENYFGGRRSLNGYGFCWDVLAKGNKGKSRWICSKTTRDRQIAKWQDKPKTEDDKEKKWLSPLCSLVLLVLKSISQCCHIFSIFLNSLFSSLSPFFYFLLVFLPLLFLSGHTAAAGSCHCIMAW